MPGDPVEVRVGEHGFSPERLAQFRHASACPTPSSRPRRWASWGWARSRRTALDVTIQAQILDLLLTLKRERRMALVLITHDLGLVAEHADRVVAQYAGRQVESNDAAPLFADPHHPDTAALLLSALPERATACLLDAIAGVVPGQFGRPAGCLFSPRCAFADTRCRSVPPPHASADLGLALCHYPLRGGVPLRLAAEASA